MTILIDKPLSSLAAWTAYFAKADIPVLPQTVSAISAMREDEEAVDAHDLAAVALRDPLMSIKVFQSFAMRKRSPQITDVETATGCIVMIGVPPFFRAFRDLTPITAHLRGNLDAQKGLLMVIQRATRAASYAFDWALRRQDRDTEVITIAALLHDISEMLLWCFAPKLALEIRAMQKAHPGLRSATAQKDVLGIELNELEHALLARWNLPELLVNMTDDSHADAMQVRNVMLAVSLARHSAGGWDDPALPDDFSMVGELLHMTPEQVRTHVDPTYREPEAA